MSPTPYSVIVHPLDSHYKGACAYEQGATGSKNAIIFIGGLGDGPHTVPFVRPLATHLEATGTGYSIFEIRMRSSFTGYGYSSLKDDAEDIAALVRYLRDIGKEKVVLLGHSTGSQDCMEYAKRTDDPVDGFILQGPVSDRQAVEGLLEPEELQESIELAAEMIAEDRGEEMMTPEQVYHIYKPVTAYRWHSLVAKGGDDDYFSSDLDEDVVAEFWGRFNKPALVLYSGEEEHAPASLDKETLVESWKKAGPKVHPSSGIVPGASHAIAEPDAQSRFNEAVAEFLKDV
ncbi:dolichol-phosphate mannosyltransferase [Sodiomyces alkalinus F11]|uniref:Dolichol-phosphate mannosyltransferase n=1 Tax=Sodiomyces alkalinus (strain CBS 110278 / VKM F-3762 / F11) TaxID=1314773 RepID=A0A3N2Q7Q1_SODAK|nr:dolichol-phosphate mannosyltransferase [Sodiomyces alkalinus F11]ROT42801.1 dolichol-phosphate mannosyltransferase [Sodiomyces alkalinus F11]